MAIKTLIYSALSLGIASGATVGGYFIFKPDTTKQESNKKSTEGTTLQGTPTDSIAPARGADGNPDTSREGNGQPAGQRPEGVQNSLDSGSRSTEPDLGTQVPSVPGGV
ncbi:hypothetical protein A6V39_03725 [Candidatus Mycoplasma haematobovis]|uniref:Uncharacterized protein n=1 Tax=Candidatus Mycoplasma haematobovis TaxID=432608 RepID=A0A1A9QDF8_9MOLU|nr:hypothetical protein [Candidatus Mycoplasma haematobovis]OAL09996.1 hypothetical protein A6V39_03725 [Candidatus Mycoplasma haematobovis]